MKRRLLAMFVLTSACIPHYLVAKQPQLETQHLPLLHIDGLTFKDFNKDGKLSPFEDWRLTPTQRSKDLLTHMQLKEKAGLMMHGSAPAIGDIIGFGDKYDIPALTPLILEAHVASFITRLDTSPDDFAKQHNQLQGIAEKSRLGIPLTISIDPRNQYLHQVPQKPSVSRFTQWPSSLGIGAIGSEKITQQFGSILRQEYRAIGVTQLLGPQADLATEPRWSRLEGTFGEQPELVKKMVSAFILGAQDGSTGLNPNSLSTVIKHWVGYGAAENGFDSHHDYGKHAIFTKGKELEQHIEPFTGAFAAHVAGVMPTYSILKNAVYQGNPIEQVGAGFNPFLLQDLLRQKYQFTGVIISDWSITEDCLMLCQNGYADDEIPQAESIAMPWGVENLAKIDRIAKAVNAGIDQFGGITDSAMLARAVEEGKISETRIDESVLRILEQKFELGQFENPFVNQSHAAQTVGRQDWQLFANQAARASLVMLKNDKKLLPVRKETKVYLYGIDPAVAERAGLIVTPLDEADIAIIRVNAPFEQPHKNFFFGARYHEGSLGFEENNPEFVEVFKASQKIPVIATVYLDRPAILTELQKYTHVLIANFGISDAVLLSALRDNKPFTGKLPIELPSSMQAVLEQQSSKPADSENPLYPIGFGL